MDLAVPTVRCLDLKESKGLKDLKAQAARGDPQAVIKDLKVTKVLLAMLAQAVLVALV